MYSTEQWKQTDSRGLYEVSTQGRVRSLNITDANGERLILKQTLTSNGYNTIQLGFDKKKRIRWYVHRLVATVFLGIAKSKKTIVNHKNGIKTDNRVENLEWTTQSRNIQLSVDNGTHPSGAKSYNAKFTDEQVRAILNKFTNENISMSKLAVEYSVGVPTISKIVKGLSYRNIAIDVC